MEEQIKDYNQSTMLKVGTVLRGIYRIDKYLSSGGFGNTYVGYNMQFDERIAIKEFFMKGVTAREDDQTSVSISNLENSDSFLEQSEKFKKEAVRLRKLKNDHIVGVHDLFEENGTAYYIMDYIDGENLSERTKRTGKPMTEEEVWKILPQVLDALQTVHKEGLWHLDLKPGNIMIDRSGNAKLIDFGASKQLDRQKGGATASTASVSYTNGYAPREQMEQNYEKFGAWTDIYALGATLYALLTKHHPPLPSDIDDDISVDKHEALPLPATVSDKMRSLILWMMATNRSRRPQTVAEILDYCDGDKKITQKIKHTKPIIDETQTDVGKQNSNTKLVIGASIVACILCIAGFLIWWINMDSDTSSNFDDGQEVIAKGNVTMVVVVIKSADKLDYFTIGEKENGKYRILSSELNYTPSEDQINVAVSSDQKRNQLNKIDAIIEKISATHASAKILFIAQRNLAADPNMKLIDKKLMGMNLSISYYNPNSFSGDEKTMVEEYVNQNF